MSHENPNNPQAATPPPPRRMRWLSTSQILVAVAITLAVAAPVAFLMGLAAGGSAPSTSDVPDGTLWTCPMHPDIKLPAPGPCPQCGMALIPMVETGGDRHPRELVMTKTAEALADIRTAPVERKFVAKSIRMVGKIDYDETRQAYITAWAPGRLDRLYVNYTGVRVNKGDHMAYVYSPDLVLAQRALQSAWRNFQRYGENDPDRALAKNLKSAEDKLRLFGVLDEQLEEIKQQEEPSDHLTIYAPIGGTVVEMHAKEGATVAKGERIYSIADLSQVWAHLDAYESDVAWLHYGQEVEFTTESYPGEVFAGRIAFIDRALNEKTRTFKVRVNVDNQEMRLKPGMFVRAEVKSRLATGGQVIDAALAGKWISPMHPEIVKDAPGQCDICGMDLVPAEELGFVAPSAGAAPPLVIPASAPLVTGKRAVVYVKDPQAAEPTYHGREILLGQRAGDYYLVRHGLEEGELIVTHGAFKIDSDLQIRAQPSMMSAEEGVASSGHQYHAGEAAADLEVSARFRAELDPVYQSYLSAADALAGDDLAAAKRAAKQLTAALKQVDPQSLGDAGRGRWKTASDRVALAAFEVVDAADRAAARRHFRNVSEGMLDMVHVFGHALPTPLHQMRCPMAFGNQGAAWLQASDDVRNPYFGAEMLQCGDVQAKFHPAAPLVVPAEFSKQLGPLYDAYLQLQTAMSREKGAAAPAAAKSLRDALDRINAEALDERAAQTWLIAQRKLSGALDADWSALPVDDVRKRFETAAGVMLGVADNFGHQRDEPLYQALCPMALDNQGAVWLQSGQEIVNPYFSGGMLSCGEIKRTFRPTSAQEPPQ